MVTLYRPPYTIHTDTNGNRVPAGTPGAVKHRGQSPTWWGRYRGADGREVQVRLSQHKETARRMLNELQRTAELASVGLGDPYAEHRRRPLAEHLADFAADLTARGNTADHCSRARSRIGAVLAEMRAILIEHLTASGVTAAIAALRARHDASPQLPAGNAFTPRELANALRIHRHSVARIARRVGVHADGKGRAARYSRSSAEAISGALPGLGIATANHYLVAVKSFTRWLVRDRRCAADPLVHLRRQNARVDVRKRRRALPAGEFVRLIEATAAGKAWRGITGPARLVLYTLAANSGLRLGELASLMPESFDWSGATVTVQAAYSKHRREDVQPLRADVLAMVQQFAMGIPAGQPLWPGPWWRRGADMIRVDLAAAGIPYEVEGRVYDAHSLRSQFGSMLAAGGVHPKVAQELMRHSDVRLTMGVYTDARLLDVAGALDALPAISGPTAAKPRADVQ